MTIFSNVPLKFQIQNSKSGEACFTSVFCWNYYYIILFERCCRLNSQLFLDEFWKPNDGIKVSIYYYLIYCTWETVSNLWLFVRRSNKHQFWLKYITQQYFFVFLFLVGYDWRMRRTGIENWRYLVSRWKVELTFIFFVLLFWT